MPARRYSFAGEAVWERIGRRPEVWADFVDFCVNLAIDPTNPEWASPVKENGVEDTWSGEFDSAAMWYVVHDAPKQPRIEFVQVTFWKDFLPD